MDTVCRLCRVYSAAAFRGQHVAPCQGGAESPPQLRAGLCPGAHTRVSARPRLRAAARPFSVKCAQGAGASEGTSRCKAVTWGWRRDLSPVTAPLGSCSEGCVPESAAVAPATSRVPGACKSCIPLPLGFSLPPLSRRTSNFGGLLSCVW